MPNLKIVGYVVMDATPDGDIEQPLQLIFRPGLPEEGLLGWCNSGDAMYLFPNPAEARKAIKRTFHYAEAFRCPDMWPKPSQCSVRTVRQAVL